MKKPLLILFLIATLSPAFAQSNNCSFPISSNGFAKLKQRVLQISNQNSRLQEALRASRQYCFSAQQVKELTQTLQSEYSRFEFAKSAFLKTVDQTNFYDVYDAFEKLSTAIRLYDYVQDKLNQNANNNNNQNDNPNNPGDNPYGIQFPNYNYPNANLYRGKTNCNNRLSNRDFYQVAREVQQAPTELMKLRRIESLLASTCMETAQTMKLASLLSSENNRLAFFKYIYSHTYDVDNFRSVLQLLTQNSYRQDIERFISQNRNNNNNNGNTGGQNCQISDQEFSDIIQQVRRTSFDKNKIPLIRTMVSQKTQCFETRHMKEFVKLLSF
ncbi:MAG: DUF4476 domain-containing protein, partial [Bacteroidota bacterium]